MEKDIFGDDPKFGDDKEKPDTSFGEGFGDIINGFIHLFKGIARIFLKKFNINLLILLILLLAVFFGAWYILKKQAPEPVITNTTCPAPEPCPELNCSVCPVKTEYINITQNVIYYKCKDGRLATNEEECKPKYPEITSADVATSAAGDVIFSIDRLDYSYEGNNSARLLKINYTIINKRETKIMPKIAVKTYEEWTPEVAAEEPHFLISHPDILNAEDWVQVSKGISIFITNRNHKISFQLQNTLPDPDENIAGARVVKILE